jgi:hypothetical protein
VTQPGTPAVLFQPRALVLAGLPLRRDDRLDQVHRRARVGRTTWLDVTYFRTRPDVPLPFGSDRSLLAWITTKGLVTGEVRFSAIADYLKTFQLDAGGKAYRTFRERWRRVTHLGIRLDEHDLGQPGTRRTLTLLPQHPAEEPDLGGDLRKLALTYDRYRLKLDPDFHRNLLETRVPTPLPVLRHFHDRPLAWDLAQFLLWRCFAAANRSHIAWSDLLAQLGTQDHHHRRLRWKLNQALRELQTFHPDLPARFLPRTGTLEIEPWTPAAEAERVLNPSRQPTRRQPEKPAPTARPAAPPTQPPRPRPTPRPQLPQPNYRPEPRWNPPPRSHRLALSEPDEARPPPG